MDASETLGQSLRSLPSGPRAAQSPTTECQVFQILGPEASLHVTQSSTLGSLNLSLGCLEREFQAARASAGQVEVPKTSFCVALQSTHQAFPVGPNSANWTMPGTLSDR